MGCVNSRADNDLHPNIFQVMNVDDDGNFVSPGRLEVTEVDIILYQRGKQHKWPLRCLRRYGYDLEGLFSFESGRRCSTGPGIYAFKCRRAQELFNLVQTKIQVRNNSGDDTESRDLPIPSHSASVASVAVQNVEPNYLDPISFRNHNHINSRFLNSQQNGIRRLNSVGSSSGPISPQGTLGSSSPPSMLPPPPPISQPHPSSLYVNEEVLSSLPIEMERNNNKSLARTVQRSPQNVSMINNAISVNGPVETELIPIPCNTEISSYDATSLLPIMTPYMNIDICGESNPISPTHSTCETNQPKEESNDIDGFEHSYMNIGPEQDLTENIAIRVRPLPLPVLQSDVEESSRHCYANLEASEIESLRKRFSGTSVAERSPLAPSTPTGCPIREVNYAVLDLDKKDTPTGTSDIVINIAPSPPESPNKPQKGYATIDFNKTAALSHSVNPNLVNDNEGCRKTRHNSTINDLAIPCRHNSVTE
ncbi:PREDICTED: fibroblast growth factor receptor substrate 3 [Cyphomyrmex costatus]|uniref:Fibroblast growth factor receptor substrate 2 n=1 Tax=Cyphomyrmex costatus TaxID=456900 RepID=A0A151IIH8_9HYME|nr:PREDICTED: fibroblast growth factor receptor substrate 3 [Cyphomyrmex costatus]KYN02489.1 Fibroblast growth factor receptor substrate 2 [Cyphomyrmex costatus]